MQLASNISYLSLTTCPLITFKDNHHVARATGFFYKKNSDIFLITNRHIFIDEEKKSYPNKIQFIVHAIENDSLSSKYLELDIYNKEKIPAWLEHPFNSNKNLPKIDIVAIKLEKELLKNAHLVTFTKNNLVPPDANVGIGEHLLVAGYPLALYDKVNVLPIVRNATVATEYGAPFENNPFFLIDSTLHEGSSGSPVVTKPSSIETNKTGAVIIGNPKSYLVGVHSAGHDYLGLNLVWYAQLIEEIIPD